MPPKDAQCAQGRNKLCTGATSVAHASNSISTRYSSEGAIATILLSHELNIKSAACRPSGSESECPIMKLYSAVDK